MADTIKFLKIRDVKSPSRANQYDAGIDFFVPRFGASFIKDLKEKNPELFPSYESVYIGAKGVSITHGDLRIGCSGNSTLTMTGCSEQKTQKVEYELNDHNNSQIKFDDEKGLNYFLLPPHARINIPSGIKVRMATPNRAFIAFNKSGVASKLGLIAGACVVDYLYQGEIHLNMINTSTKVVRIYEDMKILQLVEMPIYNSDIEVLNGREECKCKDLVTPEQFYEGMSTERGEGGFGSSDKKSKK